MDYAEIIKQLTYILMKHLTINGRQETGDMKGKIEVLIKWVKVDELSWEPLQVIKKEDYPTTLSTYTKDIEFKEAWK